MSILVFLALLSFPIVNASLDSSGYHLPVYRRGGRFVCHEAANLTKLTLTLSQTGSRYERTYREVHDNHLVRKWHDGLPGGEAQMLDEAGLRGTWYTQIEVGEPPQLLEVDLDMLAPDFYTIMTTSEYGSKYDTFSSSTYRRHDERVHLLCQNPSDIFHFSHPKSSIRLDFPTCHPPKSSRHTLSYSGTILGLSPPGSLSRFSSPSFIEQLVAQNLISHRIWSLTLLDSESGILTLGGTLARGIEEAKIRVEVELNHLADNSPQSSTVEQEIEEKLESALPSDSTIEQHFKWTSIRGAAAGWWTTLMAGVWINGGKVLKNQPVLLDVNCPFILAPPIAVKQFYNSISGARPLNEVLQSSGQNYSHAKRNEEVDRFFASPCLNAVNIAFEIGGWNFPVMHGKGTRMDGIHGPAGGLFSLGKIPTQNNTGTGYCVGVVVEARIGEKSQSAGLQDTWILGEPFFRGLGIAFDMGGGKDLKGARIGVRSY